MKIDIVTVLMSYKVFNFLFLDVAYSPQVLNKIILKTKATLHDQSKQLKIQNIKF